MAVTFKWIIYVVVQRNSLPRHPSTIPRTFKLDSSEHILRAEAVGTPSSSILESSELLGAGLILRPFLQNVYYPRPEDILSSGFVFFRIPSMKQQVISKSRWMFEVR